MNDIQQALKISADDVTRLRGCDVYRVLTQGVGYDDRLLHEVTAYLWETRPDLRDAVSEALSDIEMDKAEQE